METMILFTFLLFLHFTLCPSKDTITTNQTLKDGDLLISKGSKFALGFFSPSSSSSWRRYLGIWFYKIPGQTVVWVANRNNPINGSSGVLSINQQGNLVLYSDYNPVWWTNNSVKGAECQLLDSGNLVLVQGGNKNTLWQSFDHPTNTILMGMKLGFNKKTGEYRFLTSWRSANDPGTGNYSLRVNPSGSPQIFLYNGAKHYWRSTPWPWKLKKDPAFQAKLVHEMDEIYHNFFFYDASIVTRAVLDDSGSLKLQAWNENDGQWKDFLSVPKDRCEFHGRCGAYGLCDSSKVEKYECTCLPGYEPKVLKDWNLRNGRSGCVRKRTNSSSLCRHGEGFVKVDSVKLPDTRSAVWVGKSMSQIDCEQECKRNCSCSAYSSMIIPGNTTGCLAWYGELIDTITFFPDIGHDLYVRIDAIEFATYGTRSTSFFKSKGTLSIMIISTVSGWMIIVLFMYFWLRRKKKQRRAIKNKQKNMLFNPFKGLNNYEDALLEGGSRSHQDLVLFDLRNILAATDNFSASNMIGKGGFGIVYKGQLSDGQEIAIKRMSNTSSQGLQELRNEVMLIAKLQHKNLVKLIGCCIEKKEQMLVYEYLPNKSLDTFLFDENKKVLMNWENRFNIIIGIARGILYLYQDSRLTIIHRDLKSSNILLDSKMNSKISDFGLARLFKSDQIQSKTKRVVGTYGYMSPEYAVFGKYSVKSDVFSFGVILLEIISGQKSFGFNDADLCQSLIGLVWEKWNDGRALEIMDPSLIEACNFYEVLRCIQVGLLCVQEDDRDRPTMLDVILMLKSETTLPSLKQPAFIFRAPSNNLKASEVAERVCSINDMTISTLITR